MEPRVKFPVLLPAIGVALHQVTVLVQLVPEPGKPARSLRFAIVFDDAREDDAGAQRFVDAYAGTFALIREPLYHDSQEALRVPLVKEGEREIHYSDLLRWNPDKLDPLFDAVEFSSTLSISPEYFLGVWGLLPVVFRGPYLNASHYLDASLRDFSSLGVAAAERLGDEVHVGSGRRQLTLFESALQNTYKVVEALIGEPPQR